MKVKLLCFISFWILRDVIITLSVSLTFNVVLGLLRHAQNKLFLIELEFISNLVERKKLLSHFTSECLKYGTNLNVSIFFLNITICLSSNISNWNSLNPSFHIFKNRSKWIWFNRIKYCNNLLTSLWRCLQKKAQDTSYKHNCNNSLRSNTNLFRNFNKAIDNISWHQIPLAHHHKVSRK